MSLYSIRTMVSLGCSLLDHTRDGHPTCGRGVVALIYANASYYPVCRKHLLDNLHLEMMELSELIDLVEEENANAE